MGIYYWVNERDNIVYEVVGGGRVGDYFTTQEEAMAFVSDRARAQYEHAKSRYDALVRDGVPVKRLATAGEETGR